MTIQQIEVELLKLDVQSRARLAEKLLLSLEELSDAENEKLWAEEASRRHDELKGTLFVYLPSQTRRDVHGTGGRGESRIAPR